MSKLKVKTMMICFFDSKRVAHKEFMPPGQTVNQQSTTLKYSNGSEKESIEFGQISQIHGSFTMIMRHVIVPSVRRHFLLQKTLQYRPNPRIPLICLHVTFFCFSELNK